MGFIDESLKEDANPPLQQMALSAQVELNLEVLTQLLATVSFPGIEGTSPYFGLQLL